MRILLFEDDPGEALLTKEELKKGGKQVDISPNGRTGIGMFEESLYDVVLLDLMLPDISGLEVFRVLKNRSPDVLGIMVTGSGDERSAVEVMKEGVADYIVKATNGAHLATLPLVIERAVEHQKLKKEQEVLHKKLEEHAATLEERVVERTQELEKSRDNLARTLEETQRLEASLVQAEKLSGIGQLAAGIAHELNSPLTGIIGLARVLAKRAKTQKQSYRLLKDIEQAGIHAAKVVTELSAFARPSEGQLTEIDLKKIIERTLHFVGYQLTKKGIKIKKNFRPVRPIQGDPRQLQQVFLNMITNAADAMNASSYPEKKELTIGTRYSGDKRYVEIYFQDTGCGISPEHLGKIFDPFFTTKGDQKGVGLGLSICHTIVKNHRGTINIQTKVGKGTTFMVQLPLEDPHETKNDSRC